jgi:hypothetical protein
MPATLAAPAFRILERISLFNRLRVPSVRPSILDVYLRGDPWVVGHAPGMLGVYFGSRRLTSLSGSTIDVPALNQLLFQLRNRRPRRTSRP